MVHNKIPPQIMYKNLIYEKCDVSNQCGKDGIVSKQLEQQGNYLEKSWIHITYFTKDKSK